MIKPYDKMIVIFAASAIAILSIFFLPDPSQVVTNVAIGLFGIEVGRSL